MNFRFLCRWNSEHNMWGYKIPDSGYLSQNKIETKSKNWTEAGNIGKENIWLNLNCGGWLSKYSLQTKARRSVEIQRETIYNSLMKGLFIHQVKLFKNNIQSQQLHKLNINFSGQNEKVCGSINVLCPNSSSNNDSSSLIIILY